MKILVIHNKYRQFGGEDTVVDQEIQAYKELGYTVETFFESNTMLNFFDIIFSIFNIRSAFKLQRKIKFYQPDVIHVHNFIFKLSPSIFWVIPKHIKVFVTIHNYRFLCPSGTLFFEGQINTASKTKLGVLKNIFSGIYQNSKLKTLAITLVFKINYILGTFKHINKFVFLTNFSKQLHQNWKPNRFKNSIVKPNFLIDLDNDFKPNVLDTVYDIVFVGRVTEEKGLLNVIETLGKCNHVNISVVGDGPQFSTLKKITKKYKNITLYGNLPRKKVLMILSKSKFLIFPSLWYEGMPMTILEAFSYGKPVICRNIGAMSSMITHQHNGLKYNTLDDLNTILNTLHAYNYNALSVNAFNDFKKLYSKDIALRNLKTLVNV